jgi:hypothetical protein
VTEVRLHIGHLDADERLAGDRREDAHGRGGEREREVVGAGASLG